MAQWATCSLDVKEGHHTNNHRLAIFGITGRTGRELAKVVSLNGWEVRGLVRPTSVFEEDIGTCYIVRGNFDDLENSL